MCRALSFSSLSLSLSTTSIHVNQQYGRKNKYKRRQWLASADVGTTMLHKNAPSRYFDMRLYSIPRSFRSITRPFYSKSSKCPALLETDWLIRLGFSVQGVQLCGIGQLDDQWHIAGASPDPSFQILVSSGKSSAPTYHIGVDPQRSCLCLGRNT